MYNQYGKLFVLGAPVFFVAYCHYLLLSFSIKGKVNTLQISDRKERFLPYLYTFLSASLLVVFYSFYGATFYDLFGLGLVFSFSRRYGGEYKMEISAHMSGIGGLTGSVLRLLIISIKMRCGYI